MKFIYGVLTVLVATVLFALNAETSDTSEAFAASIYTPACPPDRVCPVQPPVVTVVVEGEVGCAAAEVGCAGVSHGRHGGILERTPLRTIISRGVERRQGRRADRQARRQSRGRLFDGCR